MSSAETPASSGHDGKGRNPDDSLSAAATFVSKVMRRPNGKVCGGGR
jgi:hypothetical protein